MRQELPGNMVSSCKMAAVAVTSFILGVLLTVASLQNYLPTQLRPQLATQLQTATGVFYAASPAEADITTALPTAPPTTTAPPPPTAHPTTTAAPACGNTPAAVRVAICISGDARALVNDRLPLHMRAAMVEPLCGAASLDIYAHLGGFGGSDVSDKPFWATAVKSEADLLRKRVSEVAGDLASVISFSIYRASYNASACQKEKCLCGSYGMAYKLRACMRDMESRERERELRYDFILRARPDFEYFRALPSAVQWDSLRRDVAWTFIATKRGKIFKGGFSGDFLHGDLLPLDQVDFIDDNMAILPRLVAPYYMSGIADEVEGCVANKKPEPFSNTDGCKNERWWWNECRIDHAFRSVRGVSLTMGMLSGGGLIGNANWLDCSLKECAYPLRRDRGDSVRDKPFLSVSLPSAVFPKAALKPP